MTHAFFAASVVAMRDLLLLLILVAACCSASGLLNTTVPVVAVSNNVAAGTSLAACPPQNSMLNTLLLQLLLSSLQQQSQQQQQAAFFNQFIQPTPPLLPATPRTTLITSSVRRTITDFFSTPVAFWMRNQRITSTLVSSAVREITELVTITSTLDNNPLIRNKRRAEVEDTYNETIDSDPETENMKEKIEMVLRNPAVQEAWLRFYNLFVKELSKQQRSQH